MKDMPITEQAKALDRWAEHNPSPAQPSYVVKVWDHGSMQGAKPFSDKELAMFYAAEANDHVDGRFHWVEVAEGE